jgi:hypothetical protein
MSYITKNRNTMYKNEKNLITLDKDLFAFASDFSDVYFANDLNWKKVAIHYKHSTSNQTRIIVLLKEQEEGWFEISEMARTGTWQIDRIQVFDKDGGMETILRAGMPSPATFDIVANRKIGPSPSISLVSGSSVTVESAADLEVGFKVKLWDNVAFQYLNATVFTIQNIVENVITLDQTITGHSGKTLLLRFPSFSEASPKQKGIYQFVGSTF